MASTIRINGLVISGDNIRVSGGSIFVDGKEVDVGDAKAITITVDGNVRSIEADVALDGLRVTGDVGSVKTMSGDVEVTGNITGGVQTMSGDVECGGEIGGDVRSMLIRLTPTNTSASVGKSEGDFLCFK